jgi:hypothetical protein
MKITGLLLSLSALVLVAGCNRGASTNNSTANKSASTNAAAPAAGGNAAGGAIDQAAIQGHWGNGNCAQTFTFNADGTATNSMDGEVARWTLAGNTLTVTPPNQAPQPSTVTQQGDNLVMNQGGQTVTLMRCPAAAPSAAGASANEADAAGDESEEK